MKTLTTAILATLSLSSAWAGNGPGPNANQQIHYTQGACPVFNTNVQLSAADSTSLAFMREEEKLAQDVYLHLATQWQLPIFGNIAQSEQTHTNQVKCLLDAYGLADSALSEQGKFNDSKLQSLYDSLIARSATSLTEALRVGALIEEVDIKDLQDALASTQIADIKMVYGNLLQGSYNHLRAFTSTLAQQGETYTAQALTPEAVTTAVAASDTLPLVLDLSTQVMMLDDVQLSRNGQLLPQHYRATLRLSQDGRSFLIEQAQLINQ